MIMLVNGHRENNSFIIALIQIIIYLQSKAKSKQEIKANANITTSCCPSCSRACNGHSCSQYLHLFIHLKMEDEVTRNKPCRVVTKRVEMFQNEVNQT